MLSSSLLDPIPAGTRLVLLGLNALARAADMSCFTYGHRGAALVSAHLLDEKEQLPVAARTRIEQLFDANWAKKKLCQPFSETDPDPDQLHKIGEALAEGRQSLREASASVDRFIGFGQGFAGHLLTFGQALVELAEMGDAE